MQSSHTVVLGSPADAPSDCRLNHEAGSQALHTQGTDLCLSVCLQSSHIFLRQFGSSQLAFNHLRYFIYSKSVAMRELIFSP